MPGLWRARVLEMGDGWARIEVRQAHPDAGAFPTSRGFALRLLHEQAWAYDANLAYRAEGPLGAAVDRKQVLDDEWVEANAARFIRNVEAEGDAVAAVDETAAVGLVASRLGMSSRLRELSDEERARFDEAYDSVWQEAGVMPARVYRITVTEPNLLAHLKPGANWSSAAF